MADIEVGQQEAMNHLFRGQKVTNRRLFAYRRGDIIKEPLPLPLIGHIIEQQDHFVHVHAKDINIAEAFAQIAVEQIFDGAVGNA